MTAPAVVILGNDALLAARPATPVQLAHACLAAGYRAVVPASWGDELVAAATLQLVGMRAERPIIQCACPHVARRVLAVGSELAPYLASVVAPPVAAARYVRRHSSGAVRITYVGRCPAAADDSIDARLTPEELLAQLADRGIELLAQPTIFESVIPPDRRRHLSLAGGVPSDDALRRRELAVETIQGDDLATEVAEKVLSATKSLLDLAPAVGCACAGAAAGAEGRAAIAELEPPRALSLVVDVSGAASLELPVTVAIRSPLDVVASPGPAPAAVAPSSDAPPAPPMTPTEPAPPRRPRLTPPGGEPVAPGPTAAAPPPQGTPRRRSTSVPRIVPGPPPVASDQEGRVLPRTYVARRRSPRLGIPIFTEPPPAPAKEAPPPAVPPAEPPSPVAPPTEPLPPSLPASRVDRAPRIGGRDTFAAAQGAARAVVDRADRGWRTVRANPRVTLALLLGAAGLLIGVAIGWAAGRRIAGGPAPNAVEAGERTDAESAGRVAAPQVTPQRQIQGPAQLPARRSATRRVRGAAPAGTAAPPVTPAPRPAAPVAVPAPVAVDSVAERAAGARRDSVQRSTARADSLAAEREAIAREIELRRARLDSLARRVGELSPPPATRPTTPPGR